MFIEILSKTNRQAERIMCWKSFHGHDEIIHSHIWTYQLLTVGKVRKILQADLLQLFREWLFPADSGMTQSYSIWHWKKTERADTPNDMTEGTTSGIWIHPDVQNSKQTRAGCTDWKSIQRLLSILYLLPYGILKERGRIDKLYFFNWPKSVGLWCSGLL